MKNEDRILELMAEALQRIDRHSERFEQVQEEIKLLREEQQKQWTEQQKQREEQQRQWKEQLRQWKEQQSRWDEQLEINRALLNKVQQHDQRLDNHSDAISVLRERTEYMHQSSLEQVKAYREISQLVIAHHRALSDKGIL